MTDFLLSINILYGHCDELSKEAIQRLLSVTKVWIATCFRHSRWRV